MTISEPQSVEDRFDALIVTLNYAPEQTGIAPYATKLAEALPTFGTGIRVLAGYPHYPRWHLHDGFHGMTMRQILNDVPVTRLRHRIPTAPSQMSRLHMELSFGIRVMLARWGKPNVILSLSPALFATGMTVIKARITGVPIGVWVQDIYSRGLEETTGNHSFLLKIMKLVEGRILRSASGVAVIHERFRKYLVDELGVHDENVRVIRNWSHVTVPEKVDRDSFRESLGWKHDEIIALHAGNMGVKQDLGNIIAAAREAAAKGSNVRFVLMGDGNQRKALEAQAEGISNLSFLAPLPDPEFVLALQAADVLIVNELPGVKEMSVPSKLTSYFATGQPIVAATESDSATADEIRSSGAGLHVQSGNPPALLAAIERLAADTDLASRCGASGISYAKEVLSAKRATIEFSEWLSTLANSIP